MAIITTWNSNADTYLDERERERVLQEAGPVEVRAGVVVADIDEAGDGWSIWLETPEGDRRYLGTVVPVRDQRRARTSDDETTKDERP